MQLACPRTRDGTKYSNIRKSAEYSNNKITFDCLIYGGKISNELKKSYQKLLKECPCKIFDFRQDRLER